MRAQFVKRLCKKYLLPNLAGFRVKGHLMYSDDMEHLLKGFYFDSSSFSRDAFTINVFVQPLFVPDDSVAFVFANRLGIIAKQKDVWWEYDEAREENVSQEILSLILSYGLPYLEGRWSLEKLVNQYKDPDLRGNKHIVEAIGYAYLLLNDYQYSKKVLRSLSDLLSQDQRNFPEVTWIQHLHDRVERILGYVHNQDYEGARQQLYEWKNTTLSNLGL